MAARNQQQEIGERQSFRGRIGQPGGQRVAFQVVDGDEGQVADRRDGLGGHDADDHPADQARPAGGGDAVQLVESQAGIGHGADNQPVEMFQMGARGDLRDDAAIGAMVGKLRQHDIGQDLPPVRDHRRGGFVATRFDTENDHF
jgi:hypothetical protein